MPTIDISPDPSLRAVLDARTLDAGHPTCPDAPKKKKKGRFKSTFAASTRLTVSWAIGKDQATLKAYMRLRPQPDSFG
jgi:hypothetical protein